MFLFLNRSNSDNKHKWRIWRFSDDTEVADDYGGVRLGNSSVDNSRMINERRFLYTVIGDESQECSADLG